MKNKNKKSYLINGLALVLLFILLNVLIKNNVISRYYQGIMVFVFINVIVASSLNLTIGFLGQLALGHAGFMAIGAYGSALFSMYIKEMALPPTALLITSLLVGGLLTGIIGYLIGLPALRLRGDYLAIITLGFGEIIRVIINNLKITRGAHGLTGIDKLVNVTNSFWIAVVVIVILYAIINSRHGRAIMSIREDEIAAEAVGINTVKYKSMGFTISAFFAGIGGGLFAHYMAYLDPNTFNFMKSVEIVTIVVLGGMGSLTGTIIASVVLTALPEMLRGFAEYRLLVYSFVLIIMMIFRPQGILGRKEFSINGLIKHSKNIIKKTGDNAEGGEL
ncbi:branched-chain amino acid ABC transporter permease [Alkalibaculum sp. M08DMB]|uniref:Branched-chain amino acid ABC transporter permease n=1 Tax=Alkalibaculum sporogenes TaxID=2655001 RepID=A0A6A7KBC1_9FIRM|nr:branched-chain amino acid ABC transporter permease [Alkalibaculum sporogenes]MPW26696.1 branched-chain amino acid ABC transporter permease [Alkalibaculum sporogenes]